ncbi:glycosyltransferase [Crystallibacter crystallopoietes]|uniref:glycosyltransferase n=1 Tax=Crystallibacter crystallopoietes TaxID=37928 RepID=UPI0009D9BABE|nr:glycosyltransferase [Arthrobacter crystallopoietes]
MSKGNVPAPVHIVEVGGKGGVFQHSLAVALCLVDAGVRVTLHTASDAELSHPRLKICPCFDWMRDAKRLRGPRIAGLYLVKTLPHINRLEGQVWLQGLFKIPLTLLSILLLRNRKDGIVFSPHTLFARHGGRFQQRLLDTCLRLAKRIVVYNSDDYERLSHLGQKVRLAPLLMHTPSVERDKLNYWKARIPNDKPVVCSVGQIRGDKNLDMLVEAAAAAGVHLVIMGPDTGALASVQNKILSYSHEVASVFEGYWPLEDMAAVVAVSGAVALPYSVASQSAVAVLGRAYGATVFAYNVGGLAEQADVVIPDLSASSWAKELRNSIQLCHREPDGTPEPPKDAESQQLLEALR